MGLSPNVITRVLCCPKREWLSRVTIGATFVCLTITVGSRFYWEPQLNIGEFAPTNIKSPKTMEITDIEATRIAKERLKQEVPPVYRLDPSLSRRAMDHLEDLLTSGDRLLQLSGELPYTTLLSYPAQIELRMLSEIEWQSLQKQANFTNPASTLTSNLKGSVKELAAHKSKLSASAYQNLVDQITKARQKYQIARQELAQSPDLFRNRLLNLSKTEWESCKQSARKILEDILLAGLVPGLPEESKQYRIRNSAYLPTDPIRRILVIDLINAVLIPNLQPDFMATREKISTVIESLQPQTVTIREGEIIVRAGQEITAREFAFLDELGLTQRRPNIWAIVLTALAVSGTIIIFKLVIVNRYLNNPKTINLKIRDLVSISLICTATATACVILSHTSIAFIPLATMGMILGSFYGSRLATVTTILGSGLVAIAISPTLISYLPLVLGAVIGSGLTDRPNTRSRISINGIVVAVIQAGTYIALAVLIGNVAPIALGINALQYAASGLLASVVALGSIPYLEQLCYAITPIRLAELANLDRPLLQKLVTEAPGTFQHTLFVANLAEAGARELGADTALVRTGTLYHDIGKTIRPEYFIENQMGQVNPHEILNDPWASADIIREHVTGGLRLAQKYHLPPLLQTFIPEHQGTIVISYFYFQAQQRSPMVCEEHFRYSGPIPQSRETGIVMLADASEAALRSLGSDTTLEEATSVMMRIFKARWDQGQLLNSGLTLEELEKLAPVFIQVWRERNHGRIKYPDFAAKVDPSGASLPIKCEPEKVEKVLTVHS
ncbi:putative domain HDIG-containing protein [Synechococcus sp. PCC 7502]|uniref:HD family phosphohydrolase n=1 Tax=Synechococcus sp. PCC 7502 TaxID=1173263 RepID=UPI00029FF218|nr:HDIG domain-containing metalloprotein [Synechococcus sp. PCC 7502]AFY75175.1 putative domain HDIG-containing protein [Synechococcus sp. PCC 7502]